MRSSRFLLTAALTVAVVLIPSAALAATVAVPAEVGYLGIVVAVWFALDKIIEITPLKDNSIIAAIRTFLNQVFAKKQP